MMTVRTPRRRSENNIHIFPVCFGPKSTSSKSLEEISFPLYFAAFTNNLHASSFFPAPYNQRGDSGRNLNISTMCVYKGRFQQIKTNI